MKLLSVTPAIAVVAAALLLAACGKQQDMKPLADRGLPPKPVTAAKQPTVSQLLERAPQAQPERIDDVLRKSQERRDDRFDLPPAG